MQRSAGNASRRSARHPSTGVAPHDFRLTFGRAKIDPTYCCGLSELSPRPVDAWSCVFVLLSSSPFGPGRRCRMTTHRPAMAQWPGSETCCHSDGSHPPCCNQHEQHTTATYTTTTTIISSSMPRYMSLSLRSITLSVHTNALKNKHQLTNITTHIYSSTGCVSECVWPFSPNCVHTILFVSGNRTVRSFVDCKLGLWIGPNMLGVSMVLG